MPRFFCALSILGLLRFFQCRPNRGNVSAFKLHHALFLFLLPLYFVMIYTAYFDESDTHGAAPTLILAAFLGSAREWELFGRRIRALQRRDGFTVFHATEFRARRNEFEGWSDRKCRRLVRDLAVAIRDELTEGVTIALPRSLYEKEYRDGYVPKKMSLDSQFGVCFRACMDRLIHILRSMKKRHRLNVVIEEGHKNANDAVKIFKEIKAIFVESGIDILGTATVMRKKDCWPLMIGDFQAHASHLSEMRLKAGLPGYFEMAAQRHGTAPPPRNEAALTQIEHNAASLRMLKTQWEERKRARMARARAAYGLAPKADGGTAPDAPK